MMPIMLGCPFEEVAPTHPLLEVGVPTGRNSHAAVKIPVARVVRPSKDRAGVTVHPSTRALQADDTGAADASDVVDPVIGTGRSRQKARESPTDDRRDTEKPPATGRMTRAMRCPNHMWNSSSRFVHLVPRVDAWRSAGPALRTSTS